ncbi:hypothetical protein SASPL_117260 [Salvia splendens]|uniref:Sugar phosphate transporter domain-containing protein n=1 Tax=Salvia splendens TaxID=180675 RepID=A0A8X8XZC9_SALSN|nr:hypothetical protein SASPL_117260 [Salvia splendens]
MELGDVHNRSPSGGDGHNRSPFGSDLNDIENGHTVNRRLHTNNDSSLNHVDYHSLSKRDTENPVSVSDVVKTLFLILAWYAISTFLTLYNKTLLGDDLGKFPAPLLMNTIHFVMQAALSTAITWYWPEMFHSSVMSWSDYFARVVPTALSTAMDVNLSNASLVFISVTFSTMCKSASPIFLLVFAFAFRLESPSVKLFGIMFVISAGILLTGNTCYTSTEDEDSKLSTQIVAKETEFDFWGFIFVMLAAVMSGFRWTMTQILLQVQETVHCYSCRYIFLF